MDTSGVFAWVSCFLLWVVLVNSQATNEKKHLEFSLTDELTPGQVISVIPEDAHFNYDANVMISLRYDIAKGDQKDYFDIDHQRGILRVTSLLDRDAICPKIPDCHILLDVAVVQPRDHFEIIKVTITLNDANDNDPRFPESEITMDLSENAAPPVSFVLPSAVDPDSGTYGVQSYELSSASPAFGLITSDDGSGLSDIRLELKEKLNREEEDMYDVYVIAKDGGEPPRSGTMTVHVVVTDANDNSPTFELSLYNVSLLENHPLYTPFLQVRATDPDQGLNGQVSYSISPQIPSETERNIFTINNITGEVSLLQHLDYEEQSTHHLLVAAQDLGPDSVAVHSKVIVHVQDVNDFVPEIHVNSWTTTGDIEVLENAQPGTFVAHVSVEDRDLGVSGKVTCHVLNNNFVLEVMYENTYKMITTVSLDRETKDEIVVTVECEDQGSPSLTSTKDITVHVVDENDHAPQFVLRVYKGRVSEASPIGTSILTVSATDDDINQNAHITYHLHANSNEMMKVDPNTGVISTNSKLDHENMNHLDFSILAIDNGKPAYSATATVSLVITDVNDEAPTFTLTSYNFGTYENMPAGTVIGQVSANDKDSAPYNQFEYGIQENKAFEMSTKGVIRTKKVLDREHQAAYYLIATATDVESPYLSGTASVTIYVADKNDNAPAIISPKGDNRTVEVSAFAPIGYMVTRIKSMDADQPDSDNSKLRFSFVKGNEAELFAIDPDAGTVSVSKDLTSTSQDAFPLHVRVQDHGENVKSAVASFTILINRTEAFAANIDLSSVINITLPTAELVHGVRRLRSQDVILIILGAITVVLVSILVTAIVCIKKRQRYRDRDSYKYMCRIDLANHISATGASAKTGTANVGGSRRGSTSSVEDEVDLEKGEFIRFDPRDSGIPAPSLSGSYSDVSNGSHVALQIALANGGEPVDTGDGSDDTADNTIHAQCPQDQHVWTTDKPMPIQHVLNVMPGERDSDSTSGCSADMSNSDGSKCPNEPNELRPITTNGNKQYKKKQCPTHGKNVRFGEVTCHSPTRNRDYSTCPLPQCGSTHLAHRLHNTTERRPQRPLPHDNRTGCHGGASSLNAKKQVAYSSPPNGRIHPQPPMVMSTFGYNETHRRPPSEQNSNQDPESRSLLMDSKKVHSVDV